MRVVLSFPQQATKQQGDEIDPPSADSTLSAGFRSSSSSSSCSQAPLPQSSSSTRSCRGDDGDCDGDTERDSSGACAAVSSSTTASSVVPIEEENVTVEVASFDRLPGAESSSSTTSKPRKRRATTLENNSDSVSDISAGGEGSRSLPAKKTKHGSGKHNPEESSVGKCSPSSQVRKAPARKKSSTAKMGRIHRGATGEGCDPARRENTSWEATELRNVTENLEGDTDSHSGDPALSNAEQLPFHVLLKERGLELVEQAGDGNCLFRAVSLQVYGDASMHGEVRQRCMDFMAKEEEHFAQFVTGEDFDEYILRKRRDGVHGNHTELQAISELFNRPVEVYVPDHGASPINIFHGDYKTEEIPIRLSYHDGNHYNAVVDPLCPTAGLGLGLPGLEPGLADRLQVEQAVEESDRLQVEKVAEDSHREEVQRVLQDSKNSVDQMMKQKALLMSDLEATDFELEQMALARSLDAIARGGKSGDRKSGRREERIQATASASTSSIGHVTASKIEGEDDSKVGSSMDPSAAIASAQPAQVGMVDSDEYPSVVQELVVNGFQLEDVVRAYELIGDNFDDILSFLMSSS